MLANRGGDSVFSLPKGVDFGKMWAQSGALLIVFNSDGFIHLQRQQVVSIGASYS